MPVEARRAWVNAAAEVSMGGHELGALAKEALAFRNDTNNWSYEAGEHALREEHGVNAPMLLQQAKAYLKEFPGVKNWIEARGLGNNPHVIKVLAARQAGREAIQKQIDELRRDPEYTAKVPRDHARARAIEEQIMALQEALHG